MIRTPASADATWGSPRSFELSNCSGET
jgi:hypothetical protein